MLALTVDDLIEYTTWQRARWQTFLREHPEALRLDAGPHGDGRFATVGDLVKHLFGAEQRYVQRLTDQPLSEYAEVPPEDLDAVFAIGEESRRALLDLLRTYPADRWDTPRDFTVLAFKVTATPKKVVLHVLLHEIRHWAQIATICRQNGLVCGWHDFITSPVFGGSFGKT
jgi:uncharacterized damage-inducible protein DinB